MNERIKELAIQAGFFYEDYKDIWYLEYHNQSCEEEMKKFAELIIQECLLAISHTPIESDEIGTMVRCHNQVKQHFGVEQ